MGPEGIDQTAFTGDLEALLAATAETVITPDGPALSVADLATTIPRTGIGPVAALNLLATYALPREGRNVDPISAARMSSPTPWVTWAAGAWSASRSDNLLHQDSHPQVGSLEARVIEWIAPLFGMSCGHLVPGATLANLTALWTARDSCGATKIVASENANGSIAKVARILQMPLVSMSCDSHGRMDLDDLTDYARRDPDGMSRTAVVLTVGTHASGVIDELKPIQSRLSGLGKNPGWWHADASWAGALMFSPSHARLLKGIDHVDSVAVAAHKMLFQPTESAFVLFRDTERMRQVLEFAGPGDIGQIGVLGSRADRSLGLALTLLAYGSDQVGAWIDASLNAITEVYQELIEMPDVAVLKRPSTGVLLWRPLTCDIDSVIDRLGPIVADHIVFEGIRWIRQVAANPLLDAQALVVIIREALDVSES